MALLPINADDPVDNRALQVALADLAPRAPVVVMIHGFKFSPAEPGRDPHHHILSMKPPRDCWKAVSWPRHLGLSGEKGLAVAFGWPARGTIWRAWAATAGASTALADLLARIRESTPGRPLHIFAHSLGAHVALRALNQTAPGTVDRMVLISAAAFRAEAARIFANPDMATTEVVNVTGRENALFDVLLRAALPHRGVTLGRGGPDLPNWLDLPLDHTESLAALGRLGYRIKPPKVPICHWSGYLRPGIWGLYRALLHRPAATPLPLLRGTVARPSRHRPRIPLPPLPFRPQTPS